MKTDRKQKMDAQIKCEIKKNMEYNLIEKIKDGKFKEAYKRFKKPSYYQKDGEVE